MLFAAGVRKQPGAIPGGIYFFKSNFDSPQFGEKEREDIINQKADLAFWYVIDKI